MKIKHKLTGDEITISRTAWEDQYLPKKLDEVYSIIEQDIVLLREIKDDGTRIPYKNLDRPHAMKMVKKEPTKYDFIEVNVDVPLDNNIDIILRELNQIYPASLYVLDYADRKLGMSERDQYIIRDALIEEGLAVPLDESRNGMSITSKGRQVVTSGGFIVYKSQRVRQEGYAPKDQFTESEIHSIYTRLDKLFCKLDRIETGQRLIYDDLLQEIEELKELAKVLGKKNWGEVFKGKLLKWGLGKLTDEGIEYLMNIVKEEKLLE